MSKNGNIKFTYCKIEANCKHDHQRF